MKLKYGIWIFIALLILISVVTHQTPQEQKKPEPTIPFESMTPAQHLARAKSIMQVDDPLSLSKEQRDEANRHMSAIPDSAPESKEAIDLMKRSVEAAKQQYLEKVRRKYTNDLQSLLQDEGFDIVVTELGDQLIMANDMFTDESNRVQFLATIRKVRDAQHLCDVGFRRVALSGRGMLAENHTYSLGCKSSRKMKSGE
jgi:soluble cytochrome b562